MVINDEWFYGNATSEIRLMKNEISHRQFSPIDLDETDARLNFTEIL